MGIRILARDLNLSIGTVSRALNDRPDVSDATRARVKSAAAACGYMPNQSGRSLRKGCTGIVAAVIPSVGYSATAHPVFFSVLEGARRTLFDAGLDLVVLFRGPGEDALENLARIVSRRIADAIIITQTCAADPRIGFLAEADVKFVAFGRSAGCDGHAWVDLDFEGASEQAVRLFQAEGHRRIAIVTNDQDANYNALMRAAFDAEAARVGYAPDARASLVTCGARLHDAGRATLADPSRAPTAFLAGNEAIAAGLYAELAALGRPVGAASAVVSATTALDPLGHAPPLSSFDTDLDAVGCALAAHLLAALSGVEPHAGPASGAVPVRLAARGSHLVRRADGPPEPETGRSIRS